MPSQINQIKDSFFYKSPKQPISFDFTAGDFNLNQLDAEFFSVYRLFIANKSRWENDRENEVVLLVDALCDLMIQYHECHFVQGKLADLKKKKEEITAFRESKPLVATNKIIPNSLFIENKWIDKLLVFVRSLNSTAQLNSHLGNLDDYRTYWNNCRNLANHLVLSLQGNGVSQFIDAMNRRIGHPYNTDDFLKMLNKPNNTLAALSVGIYSLRFMLNLVVMCKHSIEAALGNKLSGQKVLQQEMEMRGFTMLNDMVWGPVNLLIYRQKMFHLSSAAIVNTVAVSLVFNVAQVVMHWLFDLIKHHNCILALEKQKGNLAIGSQKLAVINRQIDILNDEWEAQSAYHAFNLAAASSQAVGFGVIFLLFGSLSLTYVFSMMLGSALYFTANDFKSYQQASVAVHRELLNGKGANDSTHQKILKELTADYHKASTNFWKNLAYNTAGPTFIVTVAAISWPVALLITVSYLAYQSVNANKAELTANKQESHGLYRLFDGLSKVKNHGILLIDNAPSYT